MNGKFSANTPFVTHEQYVERQAWLDHTPNWLIHLLWLFRRSYCPDCKQVTGWRTRKDKTELYADCRSCNTCFYFESV